MKDATEKPNYKSRINKRRFKTKFLSLIFLLFSVTLCLIMFSGCASESEPQCNHEWSEWEETSVATCTKSGMQQRTCSICGQTESKGIARLSSTGQHTPTEWTVTKTATCTEPGEQESTCSVCGETITDEIEPLGHQLGEWEIGTEATAYASGEKIQKCTVCGEIVNRDTYYLSDEERTAQINADVAVTFPLTVVSSSQEYGFVRIDYIITNNSESNISNLEIYGTLYDSAGNAVTSDYSHVWGTIPPGQSKEGAFITNWSQPVASYNLQYTEIYLDNGVNLVSELTQ